ncbi:hypothetical protein Pelo_10911 [Pelomyxa schiedti]|nr:hypothetical protein Pelo_10911 [Pelomyxa schiedti]
MSTAYDCNEWDNKGSTATDVASTSISSLCGGDRDAAPRAVAEDTARDLAADALEAEIKRCCGAESTTAIASYGLCVASPTGKHVAAVVEGSKVCSYCGLVIDDCQLTSTCELVMHQGKAVPTGHLVDSRGAVYRQHNKIHSEAQNALRNEEVLRKIVESVTTDFHLPTKLVSEILAKARLLKDRNVWRNGEAGKEIVAALIYIFGRQKKDGFQMFTVNQVAVRTGLSPDAIGKAYRSCVLELDMVVPPLDLRALLSRCVKEVKPDYRASKSTPEKTVNKAMALIEFLRHYELMNDVKPPVLAAAALHLVLEAEDVAYIQGSEAPSAESQHQINADPQHQYNADPQHQSKTDRQPNKEIQPRQPISPFICQAFLVTPGPVEKQVRDILRILLDAAQKAPFASHWSLKDARSSLPYLLENLGLIQLICDHALSSQSFHIASQECSESQNTLPPASLPVQESTANSASSNFEQVQSKSEVEEKEVFCNSLQPGVESLQSTILKPVPYFVYQPERASLPTKSVFKKDRRRSMRKLTGRTGGKESDYQINYTTVAETIPPPPVVESSSTTLSLPDNQVSATQTPQHFNSFQSIIPTIQSKSQKSTPADSSLFPSLSDSVSSPSGSSQSGPATPSSFMSTPSLPPCTPSDSIYSPLAKSIAVSPSLDTTYPITPSSASLITPAASPMTPSVQFLSGNPFDPSLSLLAPVQRQLLVAPHFEGTAQLPRSFIKQQKATARLAYKIEQAAKRIEIANRPSATLSMKSLQPQGFEALDEMPSQIPDLSEEEADLFCNIDNEDVAIETLLHWGCPPEKILCGHLESLLAEQRDHAGGYSSDDEEVSACVKQVEGHAGVCQQMYAYNDLEPVAGRKRSCACGPKPTLPKETEPKRSKVNLDKLLELELAKELQSQSW